MRDDVIIGKEDVWATSMEDATFNGEFAIKAMNKHGELDIDKSGNYKATEEEVSPIKYVKPYKLIVDFSKDLASQLKMFNDSEIYYIGQLSKSDYAANESKLTKQPLLSTLTVYFNTKNASLAKADARKALSTAVDRNGLAELIGLGTKPATGFITEGFYDSSLGSNFRKAGGDLISASADSSKAKSLASSGGLTGSLKLTYLKSDDNDAIASKLINDWKAAGINVTADALNESSYVKAIKEGTFDMLLIEYQGLSTNAASVLAPYARKYSGESVSVADDSVGYTPHITGFESDAYDAAIDSVFEAVTRGERATALHAAEELLVNEMPAAPLAFFYDYYMASSELSGLRSSAYGYRLFTNVVLKDYKEKNAAYEAKNAENGSEA